MPGKEWKRPGEAESNAVEGKDTRAAGWHEPAPVVPTDDEVVAELERQFAETSPTTVLDTPIRLSRTKVRPAEAQSDPRDISSAFVLSVGDRVVYSGNVWRFVVCGLGTLLVVLSLVTYLMASTLLTFSLLVGSLFVFPTAVGVLAHNGRLTDD